MKVQELIDLLNQQAKEIADANIAGWGNTMLEAANRLEQLVMVQKPEDIEFARIVIKEFNDYAVCHDSDALFIKKLKDYGISEMHIADVIQTINDTCHHCWDSESGCQCWNDE